jgi:sorting nexin-13
MGAYFEKIGSTSFAVYSIAVTDAQNKTWFVKRRFTSFLHLYSNECSQIIFFLSVKMPG